MKLVTLALAVLLCSFSADATLIEFESGGFDGGGVYTESGFDFTVAGYTGGNADFQAPANPGNGSRIFALCSIDGPCTPSTYVTLTSTDLSPFSISSIDASNWQTYAMSGTIELVGSIFGGGSISQSISIGDTWASFELNSFNNLTSLEIIGSEVYAVAFDNLNMTSANPVPIPSTLFLMMLSVVGLLIARKNKTR